MSRKLSNMNFDFNQFPVFQDRSEPSPQIKIARPQSDFDSDYVGYEESRNEPSYYCQTFWEILATGVTRNPK